MALMFTEVNIHGKLGSGNSRNLESDNTEKLDLTLMYERIRANQIWWKSDINHFDTEIFT